MEENLQRVRDEDEPSTQSDRAEAPNTDEFTVGLPLTAPSIEEIFNDPSSVDAGWGFAADSLDGFDGDDPVKDAVARLGALSVGDAPAEDVPTAEAPERDDKARNFLIGQLARPARDKSADVADSGIDLAALVAPEADAPSSLLGDRDAAADAEPQAPEPEAKAPEPVEAEAHKPAEIEDEPPRSDEGEAQPAAEEPAAEEAEAAPDEAESGTADPSLSDLIALAEYEIEHRDAVTEVVTAEGETRRVDTSFRVHADALARGTAPGRVKLTIGPADQLDARYALPTVGARVGRSADNDIVVDDDNQAVSAHHARFGFRGGRYTVVDLGSTVGTFVNGRAVDGEQLLEHGDHVVIGPAIFEFELENHVRPQSIPPASRRRRASRDEVAQHAASDAALRAVSASYREAREVAESIFSLATSRRFGIFPRPATRPGAFSRRTLERQARDLSDFAEHIVAAVGQMRERPRPADAVWAQIDTARGPATCWQLWAARAVADLAVHPALLLTILGIDAEDAERLMPWALNPAGHGEQAAIELLWAFVRLAEAERDTLRGATFVRSAGDLLLMLDLDAEGRASRLSRAILFHDPNDTYGHKSHVALANVRACAHGVAVGRDLDVVGEVLRVTFRFKARRL